VKIKTDFGMQTEAPQRSLVVKLGIRKSFQTLAPGNSLRRRTAYSLALTRLIVVPVIVVAVYCLRPHVARQHLGELYVAPRGSEALARFEGGSEPRCRGEL
jgi:hypothetical protein